MPSLSVARSRGDARLASSSRLNMSGAACGSGATRPRSSRSARRLSGRTRRDTASSAAEFGQNLIRGDGLPTLSFIVAARYRGVEAGALFLIPIITVVEHGHGSRLPRGLPHGHPRPAGWSETVNRYCHSAAQGGPAMRRRIHLHPLGEPDRCDPAARVRLARSLRRELAEPIGGGDPAVHEKSRYR
jgi:hypothetical protein